MWQNEHLKRADAYRTERNETKQTINEIESERGKNAVAGFEMRFTAMQSKYIWFAPVY